MQTRFYSLVRLRKQKVDEVERAISANNRNIQLTEEAILGFTEEMLSLQTPEKGGFNQLLQFQDMKRVYTQQIRQKQLDLKQLHKYAKTLQKMLKEVSIEFEKAKHLDDVEREKIIKEREKLEEAEMNEISIMLHNNNAKTGDQP